MGRKALAHLKSTTMAESPADLLEGEHREIDCGIEPFATGPTQDSAT